MSTPKRGEVRAVSGGHGLMLVLRYDELQGAAEMLGHGRKAADAPPASCRGHWFYLARLGEPVGADVVLRERAEARARNVMCHFPFCWCGEVAP